MINYGYIKDFSKYTQHEDDIVWDFERMDEDGSVTQYKGIETKRRPKDKNLFFIGDKAAFREWKTEFEIDDL